MTTIQIFNFSGNQKYVLTCAECGEKCATIEQKRDKYKITVDCPICEMPHIFTPTFSKFWHSELMTYKCPDSGLEIYFQGTHRRVKEALDKQEELLADMEQQQQLMFDKEFLINEMIRYIEFLASSDAIMCTCGSLDIQINITDECITLICQDCGTEKIFYPNEKSLALLLSCNIIILDNDNE